MKDNRTTMVLSPDSESTAVVPVHFFNGRIIIFICLLLLIIFLFVTPVTSYFSQQTEISRQENVLYQVRQEKEGLAELRERQGDEEYLKQQARQRLRMAVPGETPYIVVGQVPEDEQHSEAFIQGEKSVRESSWPQKVLDSVSQNIGHK